MVSSCCVKGCTEKFVKGGGVSYFRISSKPEMQRNAWILALKRIGWTPKPHHRICSRHFVTGTWNADPNHIDYIPTRCMNKEGAGYFDASVNEDSLDTTFLENSVANSVKNTSLECSDIQLNGASLLPFTSIDSGHANSPSKISTARIPIMGLSSTLFSGVTSAVNSHRSRRKMSRKNLRKWNSSPKLTSNHFCEHQDAHRNCCRVIRELAEENQILKSQVACLLFEMEKVKSQSPHKKVADGSISIQPKLQINGISLAYQNSLQDIEVVSDSPPSLGIDDELGLVINDFPEDGDV